MNKNIQDQGFQFSVSDYKPYLLLFIVWPFMAFIAALSNYKRNEAKKIVYLFIIYYGITYFLAQEGGITDAYEYARRLRLNADLPFSDFFKIVGGLYTSDTSVDIIEPLISFIVSRFTSHHSLLFASYAALFGFFYLKSINLLHERYQEKPGWNAMIFMVFFILVIPITSISAPRMWTAAWAFFYGAYHVVLNHDKKYFLLTLGACFMHWSFIMANAILMIYFLAGNRNLIYIPITIVSFLMSQIIAPVLHSISLRLQGGLQNRYTSYTNEEYILDQQESWQQASWFLLLSKNLIFYYLIFVILVIYLLYRDLMKEKAEKNLFSFLLLFLSFVNFGKTIPNFGDRFQIVFMLFATLYVFFYSLKLQRNNINLLNLIGLFPMALYTLVEFRIGSPGINSWIFLPGFGIPLIAPGISLADFLFE